MSPPFHLLDCPNRHIIIIQEFLNFGNAVKTVRFFSLLHPEATDINPRQSFALQNFATPLERGLHHQFKRIT